MHIAELLLFSVSSAAIIHKLVAPALDGCSAACADCDPHALLLPARVRHF